MSGRRPPRDARTGLEPFPSRARLDALLRQRTGRGLADVLGTAPRPRPRPRCTAVLPRGPVATAPLVLWAPAPPDNANARQHWTVANREKRRYQAALSQRALAGHGIPPVPAEPIAHAEITCEWHYPDRRHHLDPTNAIRRLKPLEDWLVAEGYLAGDTPAHVRWLPIVVVVGQPTPPLCTVRLVVTPLPMLP